MRSVDRCRRADAMPCHPCSQPRLAGQDAAPLHYFRSMHREHDLYGIDADCFGTRSCLATDHGLATGTEKATLCPQWRGLNVAAEWL